MIAADFIVRVVVDYSFSRLEYDEGEQNVYMYFRGRLSKRDVIDIYSMYLGVSHAEIDPYSVVANYNPLTKETIVSMWK